MRRPAGICPGAISFFPAPSAHTPAPWHFLYFLPDPHGQGSFRPTGFTPPSLSPGRPGEVSALGDGARGGGGRPPIGPVRVPTGPVKRSSAAERVTTGGGGGGPGRSAAPRPVM